ncbi:MAG: LEPR-XLL domain-containing protein, partial [Gammaproteobacteria bacterium]|nr:LEPR-XLL domain-containing protein [Gammaproteobacteria bacterium]
MSWIRVLERLHNSRSESDPVPSPFHFERLEPRILLSADFLPGFSDQDPSDQDQLEDNAPDLQPLIAFLSSPLDKQTVKDSLSVLPEPLQLGALQDAYGDELNHQQTSASLIDDLSFLLAPEANDSETRLEIII